VNWVVFKVAQRCNLDCTYCYVYHRGDTSWRDRPAFPASGVVEVLGRRIAEHCASHEIETFTVELHGGEPLLYGKRRIAHLVDSLRAAATHVRLDIVLQTNGLLLDEEWLELFSRHGITFGLSLDGPPEHADRSRIRHNGAGSTAELLERIAALRARGGLFDRLNSGVLCVVDPAMGGADLVRWYADMGFEAVDFLLPDGHHANLPAGWTGPGRYANFLLDAFDAWRALDARAPRIRLFEEMIRAFLGVPSALDSLGGDLRKLCVVETDGTIGISDAARICGGRFARDELSVFVDPLDRHAEHYGVGELQRVCDACRSCPFVGVSGGGYLTHRFDGATFDNPSIYCPALCALAHRIYEQLGRDLPPELWAGTGAEIERRTASGRWAHGPVASG
jgi:uncharacterized protein